MQPHGTCSITQPDTRRYINDYINDAISETPTRIPTHRAPRFPTAILALTLGLGLAILTMVHPVAAQGTGLFPGDDQQIGNGVREAIKWARNLLFLLGFVGIGWMILNLMTEKSWGRQLLGGILCWGFGGLAALAYSFSQGSAVDLPTE